MKKLKIFLISISIILVLTLLTIKILIPSYNSYAFVCKEDFNRESFVVLGVTKIIINESNEQEIIIQIKESLSGKERLRTIKHENCHKSQILRGFPSLSCSDPIQKYLSEVECYTAEYLPSFLYD